MLHQASESAAFQAPLRQLAEAERKSANSLKSSDLQTSGETSSEMLAAINAGNIQSFVLERLRNYYADQSVPGQQFDAVEALATTLDTLTLYDFDRRLKAIAEFAKLPEAEALAAANKRIRNILKKVDGDLPTAIDPARFVESAERELAEVVDTAIADTDPLLAQRDYVAVLGRLARLRPQVDAFFTHVMVNVDDLDVRNNRLALLKRLSDRLGSVAAIEHLSI
jgi:glycyl-tRNA synthetase beta chain